MSARDLVSVIIPAYNYARFLPATLHSALAQDGVAREIVVVDDGSTDDTPEVLARFRPDIVWHTQENRGLSAARNAGLALARGNYVVFLDADDLLGPGVLAAQWRALQAGGSVTVCRNRFFTDTDAAGQPQACGEWRLFRDDLTAHLCHFNIAPPHAFLVRREALERVGGFDTGLGACEDYDLWFRLAVAGAPPLANPAVAVGYRRHAGSMSRDLDRQYAHDARLHHRVAAAVLGGDFPVRLRLEGLLGCLAGCLLTRQRLAPRRPELARGLDQPIGALVRCLNQEAPAPAGNPQTSRYFLLRIAVVLEASDPTADPSGATLADSALVRDLLARFWARQASSALPREAASLRDSLDWLTASLVY